jgi:hypothetical protein
MDANLTSSLGQPVLKGMEGDCAVDAVDVDVDDGAEDAAFDDGLLPSWSSS